MRERLTLLLLGFLASCSPGEKVTLTYPDGMRKAEGHMSEKGKDGEWSFWNEDGQLQAQGEFKKARMEMKNEIDKAQEDSTEDS